MKRLPLQRSMVMLLLMTAVPAAARADSVKIGGLWTDKITVQSFTDGNVVFTSESGAERTYPLARLEGIKSTQFPTLTEAQAALDAKDSKTAMTKFNDAAAAAARTPWARQWALWHKVALLDKDGEPVDALMTYMDLVKEKADPYFLAAPPLNAMKRVKPEQAADMLGRVEAGRKAAGKVAQDQFKSMADIVKAQVPAAAPAPATPAAPTAGMGAAPAAPAVPSGGAGGGTQATAKPTPAPVAAAPTPQITSASAESAVPLPVMMDLADPITVLLRGGRFAEVLTATHEHLQKKEPLMAMRLYQRGVAQLQLGLAANDQDLIKDAGLSFMRVIVYYGRGGYKGPALLELGLVHQKIGQPTLAAELWRKARVEIDPDTDPALIKRLDSLTGGPEAENTEAAPAKGAAPEKIAP